MQFFRSRHKRPYIESLTYKKIKSDQSKKNSDIKTNKKPK